MTTIGIKRILVYKSHIFPQMRKPFRNTIDFFQMKNPDLDRVKVKKMYQLLDDEEKKRLRQQKDLLNDEINATLHKYYLNYIRPFESCPDFYSMLFDYAVKKMEVLLEDQQKLNQLEPFFMERAMIKNIARSVVKRFEDKRLASKQTESEQKKLPTEETQNLSTSAAKQSQNESHKRQKLLFEIYSQLYPSQKTYMYSTFLRAYKNFISKQQTISQQLRQNTIFHLKPFLLKSPVEFYQAQNPDKTMQECERVLIGDVIKRERVCIGFTKLVEQRERDLKFVQQRFGVSATFIKWNLVDSYANADKYKNFYSMLTTR